jgi:Fic family protein
LGLCVWSARTLVDLQARYRALLHGKRITKSTNQLLDELFGNPVVTVRRVQEVCKVGVNTASRAIQDLEEVGILRQVATRRRNRMWIAHEILGLLTRDRPPAGEDAACEEITG